MTFEAIYTGLSTGKMKPEDAYNEISKSDKMKTINYYIHLSDIKSEPLSDSQLSELEAICNILQVLYTASIGSPISDSQYDILEEELIDMGIPRLTGSIEINDNTKVAHTYKTLRGTLGKVYYLSTDEPRTNKSRKYLDEWIHSAEMLYQKNSGKTINLNDVTIVCQPKFDGCSCILEWDGKDAMWLSRGDTANNKASDISHIMHIFNNRFANGDPKGEKFEVMMSEEDKDGINSRYTGTRYKNSRQVVTSILNSNEVDYKSEFLYPVPLRIIHPGEDIETLDPLLFKYFPTMVCKFGDIEKIREFANHHRHVVTPSGKHLRTDGVVMTITDPTIQKILGRENNINNFEVAYKFTEESTYTRVRNVEFYVSEFGYITPVVVTNDVILKGNTINHISLSNKERFDELDLHYGDGIKVLYDIIPYATVDEKCIKQPNARKIEFVKECPRCGAPLDLNVTQVQCKNPDCPSRIVGRILNYCNGVRIKNIGYNTLAILYDAGLLPHGIRSLYALRKKKLDMEKIDGFGMLKINKIVSEIEAKRRLKDYEFFGALGIEGLNTKSFKVIFENIKLDTFIDLLMNRDFKELKSQLVGIPGIGEAKAKCITDAFKDQKERKELQKTLKEVSLSSTFGSNTQNKGRVVFTGCRPDADIDEYLSSVGYESSDSWINSAKYLVVPNLTFESSKVNKARSHGTPIVPINEIKEEIK